MIERKDILSYTWYAFMKYSRQVKKWTDYGIMLNIK